MTKLDLSIATSEMLDVIETFEIEDRPDGKRNIKFTLRDKIPAFAKLIQFTEHCEMAIKFIDVPNADPSKNTKALFKVSYNYPGEPTQETTWLTELDKATERAVLFVADGATNVCVIREWLAGYPL